MQPSRTCVSFGEECSRKLPWKLRHLKRKRVRRDLPAKMKTNSRGGLWQPISGSLKVNKPTWCALSDVQCDKMASLCKSNSYFVCNTVFQIIFIAVVRIWWYSDYSDELVVGERSFTKISLPPSGEWKTVATHSFHPNQHASVYQWSLTCIVRVKLLLKQWSKSMAKSSWMKQLDAPLRRE